MNAAQALDRRREITDLRCRMANLKAMGVVEGDLAKLDRLIHEAEAHLAFDEAKALVVELGRDHPKAMAAIVRAVDLADPEFIDRTFVELCRPSNSVRPS